MNWTEILGFLTGAASVLLAVRESAWNWPVGIATHLFPDLFWKAKLYADALLQIVYIVISIFGWWNWYTAARPHRTAHQQDHGANWNPSRLVITAATAAAGFRFHRFTDSTVPFWDGVTTALSLTAQYM